MKRERSFVSAKSTKKSKNRWRQFIGEVTVLLLSALVLALLAGRLHPRKPTWIRAGKEWEVEIADLYKMQPALLWIDARSIESYDLGHIPGALPLNEDRWNELLPTVLDHWNPGVKVVVYCSRQSCDTSRAVTERLRDEVGLPDVYFLKGGWESWRTTKHQD